jgi:phosphoribosylanthranilate isomerase
MIRRTRVKICGVRRPEDAVAAARAGADAIGLVFHPPAPRYVCPDVAREILDVLPAFVTPVGLFVDADIEALLWTVRTLGLRHVQLNGSEKPEYVHDLPTLAVLKSVTMDDGLADTLSAWRMMDDALRLKNLKGFVLETPGTGRPGGTGVPNDWAAVVEHQARGTFDHLPPVIAAGGLTPESVGGVVRAVRPYAVDVSSGVEASRGIKSAEKIEAFVAAVRRADEEPSPIDRAAP